MNKVRNNKGFTLVELMVVLAILGLLVAIVVPDLMKVREESTVEATKASLRGVQSALELYYTKYKYYPQTLKVLIQESYVQEGADRDPWQRYYYYQAVVEGSQGVATNYILCSAGKDGRVGSDDDVDAPVNPSRHSPKQKATADVVR